MPCSSATLKCLLDRPTPLCSLPLLATTASPSVSCMQRGHGHGGAHDPSH